MEHILIHCSMVKELWNLLFALSSVAWLFFLFWLETHSLVGEDLL